MHVSQKINLKKYIGFTLIFYFGLCYFFNNFAFFYESSTVLILFIVNHFLFIISFAPLFDQTKELKAKNAFRFMPLFVAKFFMLGGVFYYLATYSRERIVFYLLMYIFQLIILLLSIKRDGSKN